VVYQAFVGSRNASDVAHVLVRVGERLVVAQVKVTVFLEAAGNLANDSITAVATAFVGQNQLTNAAFHLAESWLAEILYECSGTHSAAFGKDDGNDIHVSLKQLGTPVLTRTFNASNDHTTVEV
jgi:protein gp37